MKTLYIMRGLSGSGKSTLAKDLVGSGVIFSTDDLFVENGVYNFDPRKLGLNHKKNQERAVEAMEKGINPVIIDNTHTQSWEAKPYVEAGVKFGYNVEFVEPDTPWKFNAKELANKNKHGVPLVAIQRMLDRWESDMSVESCLNAKSR